MLYSNTIFEQAYTVPNLANLSDPLNKLYLTEQSRQFLAIEEAQAQLCHENMDVEDLKYMGTSTVVRDMDFMTEVLDGKGTKMSVFFAFFKKSVLKVSPAARHYSRLIPRQHVHISVSRCI
jgi:hypothetical protein